MCEGRTDFGGVLASLLSDLADMDALRASLTNYFRDVQCLDGPKRADHIILRKRNVSALVAGSGGKRSPGSPTLQSRGGSFSRE